jgi:hypothetical protein
MLKRAAIGDHWFGRGGDHAVFGTLIGAGARHFHPLDFLPCWWRSVLPAAYPAQRSRGWRSG